MSFLHLWVIGIIFSIKHIVILLVFHSVMNLNALNLISFWRDSININSWKKRQF